MNILALGAHPDDVEFLCAGTLLKYKKQGHKIFIALTTSGNIGSNVVESRKEIARIREQEQLEAAKYYEADVRFLRFDDEGLLDTPETRRAVINAIRWANPDVILTNPPFDQSTDHAMTGKIVSEVILSLPGKLIPADEEPITKKPSVFFWDIPGGIGFNPEIYVDISEFIEIKLEVLNKHQSQISWMGVFMADEFLITVKPWPGYEAYRRDLNTQKASLAIRSSDIWLITGFFRNRGISCENQKKGAGPIKDGIRNICHPHRW